MYDQYEEDAARLMKSFVCFHANEYTTTSIYGKTHIAVWCWDCGKFIRQELRPYAPKGTIEYKSAWR